MFPNENRGDATYMLFLTSVRPVQETTGVACTLSFDEYRAASSAVTWAQHSGKLPMPLLRLARAADEPACVLVGLEQLVQHLSSGRKGFPKFTVQRHDFPSLQPLVPAKLSVDKALKQTKQALKELRSA